MGQQGTNVPLVVVLAEPAYLRLGAPGDPASARVRRSGRPEPARAGQAPAVPVAVAVPIADGLFALARRTNDVADTVRVEDHSCGAAGHLPHAHSARPGRSAVRTEVTSHARFIGSVGPRLEGGLESEPFATSRGRRTWDSGAGYLARSVLGCTARSIGGRGGCAKSKSRLRSPSIGAFSRTSGRGSGRPSVRGSSLSP